MILRIAAIRVTSQADEDKDRSQAWIRYMLLLQLPELPKSKAGLIKVLFLEQHRKLPIYNYVTIGVSELAAEVLIEAGGSSLSSVVGALLLHQYGHAVTEIQLTLLVASCFGEFLNLFKLYSKDHFQVKLSCKSTKSWEHSYSHSIEPLLDTIVVVSGCTLVNE